MSEFEDGRDVQSMSVESGMVAVLNKSEIDQQIATAHRYPRSIKRFRDESLQMVTLNERIAESCIYALPRGGKTIEGPSARFAEVVASAWGNCRAGARTISDQGDFVTAQGVFHDLERNVAITYEVQRRITDSKGNRYNADMIGVTANAACSVALRNAILKGVPKAFWDDMYQAARQTVMGDFKTLANRRADALKAFQSLGISETQVFAKLEVGGIEDISLEHLVTLRGLITAIKEGDTTPEQAFAVDGQAPSAGQKQPATYSQEDFDKNIAGWSNLISIGKKTPDQIIAMVESKGKLSDDQKAKIRAIQAAPQGNGLSFASVAEKINKADGLDVLDVAADLIGEVSDEGQRRELTELYNQRKEELSA
ncbi:MAG: hypothetical protein EG825_00265 [Rhodocyclaceae bacterium]|nr:hypothetical protein [Rhodocyclaceae bacterium]